MTSERKLRTYDKALRLRRSVELPDTILLERKTFRGQIGSIGPGGIDWTPDFGRRKEEGHVLILSINREELNIPRLLDALKQADTWKHEKPLWQRFEEADEQAAKRKKLTRTDIIRYKTHELYDRYVWKEKSRVSVPARII